MQQPVIVCGLGRVGWPVLLFLKAAGLNVVAIDKRAKPDDPRLAGVRLIQGDCQHKEVLEQAGLPEARGILILTGDDLVNISAALTVRSLHPEVRIVVRLFNENLMARLSRSVKNVYALSVPGLTAPVVAMTALTGTGLGTFQAGDGLRQVGEICVGEWSGLSGGPIARVAHQHRLSVLAHLPAQGPERFLLEIDGAVPLEAGDRLVVCGKPDDLTPLRPDGEAELLPVLRWAGWLRRTGRVLLGTFREIELPVKIATSVLLAVVVAGTLVYHLGMDRPIGHSLFRTISVIATGADMHEEELPQEWHKVFVSSLRLMGAALIAGFTAILTNYLVRARLYPALEVRRIPDSGHVVVCGLGNIGFRVVEELLQRGEQAVAIERSVDSRFITTARRLGAAVIVADATVPQALQQANVGAAKAVVATTENALVNLEIALLVRDLNPRQRVVVRLGDPYLAQLLREAANIRLALSTGSLAAPAFVAALFGDRVLNLFLIAGKVLAAVEVTVQADETSRLGQPVKGLAQEYHLLPVTVMRGGQALPEPLGQNLAAGDRLTAIVALPDLARLLRGERTSGAARGRFPPSPLGRGSG